MSVITPDYYEILELPRKASQEDIKEAYRYLSLKYHPSRATDALKQVYEYKFHQIAEAYIVLSDPNKKGIFDIYGKEGLYKGLRDPKTGNIKGAFKYTGNAYQIFDKYMNETNPFSLIRDSDRMDDEYGSIFGSANGGENQKEPEKLKDINVNLEISLEDLYNGAIKFVRYKANCFNTDKRTTSLREREVKVEIFPGYESDKILTFKGQGHDCPGMKSSDLIVHLKLIKHEHFSIINKSDLVYYATIKLDEALNSGNVQINTLDGRILYVSNDEIISPSTVKVVKGEGMPIYNKNENAEGYLFNREKGDLIIRFNVIFPEYINAKKKERIVELLKQYEK